MCETEKQWFAIRVTYHRELKFQKALDAAGFRTFVPMCMKKTVRDGIEKTETVPAVNNLCFVRTTRAEFNDFLAGCGPSCPARYIWDRASRQPIVVPEKAMDDFIKICGTMHEDLVYLTRVSSKLRLGQRVRVCSGPFEGVEGIVVRIRRSRRIMVELPGMLAVATTYVSPENVVPV